MYKKGDGAARSGACRDFPRSAFKICNSLDILAAEWGVSGGGGGPRATRRVGRFLSFFYRRPSSACTSIRGGGPAEIRGLGPPADAECRGGPGEVCLGGDFVWRSALYGGLRKTLLSALAKEENWTQDCTVWIVHVYAEDRKDFDGSRGVGSLRPQ